MRERFGSEGKGLFKPSTLTPLLSELPFPGTEGFILGSQMQSRHDSSPTVDLTGELLK